MASVPWVTLSPSQVEQVVGVMLCREHPRANRVRPGRGDGGIDILVPIHDALSDVFQVKSFATSLTLSQKSQIEHSLMRISDNTSLTVRDWYLTLPLNPTPNDLEWFRKLCKGQAFSCTWFGLDHLESLAAKYPDVVDYYVHDGKERLVSTIQNLRSIAGFGPGTASAIVGPKDSQAPLAALYTLLNQNDPHFRYSFEVDEASLQVVASDRPGLLASVQNVFDGVAVTHHVFARYDFATHDAPIPLSFQVVESDLDPKTLEAWKQSLLFGTPAEIEVRNLSSGLPGGLDETFDRGLLRIGPARDPSMSPQRLRLGVIDEQGEVLADVVIEMEALTQGFQGGRRAVGVERGGSFRVEILLLPPAEGPDRMTVNLSPADPALMIPAAIVKGIQLLREVHRPNRLAVGPEFGPFQGSPIEIPNDEPPVNEVLVEVIESLALLQDKIRPNLLVPEIEALTPQSCLEIVTAATLVRGEEVTEVWQSEEFLLDASANIPNGPAQLARELNYAFSVGDQTVDIGIVTVQWMAADISTEPTEEGGIRVTARPAFGNNTRIVRRRPIGEVPPISIVSESPNRDKKD
jgi:hypothetical protein